MSISFRNPKVEILAREVAERCHISMTQAIIDALEEKKRSLPKKSAIQELLFRKIKEISVECSSLPDLDLRSPEEILEYDLNGLFQ